LHEVADTAVRVRLLRREQHLLPVQLTRTRAGSPRPVSSTCVEMEGVCVTSGGAILRACTRCSRAISPSSARTRWPSRMTSAAHEEPVDRWGPARTRAATGSSAPASSSRSVGQTARSAQRPGSIVPMSSRPSTRAPCVASREGSAGRHRLRPSRRARRAGLLELVAEVAALVRGRSVDAETDRTRRRGAHGRARHRRRGEGSTSDSARRPCEWRETRDVRLGQVDAVRTPDVVVEPAELGDVFERPTAVELAAVRLLLGRLGEVGMKPEPEPACKRRRLDHEAARHRERRAGRDGDLHARARRGS
jgi:hypothetical protein